MVTYSDGQSHLWALHWLFWCGIDNRCSNPFARVSMHLPSEASACLSQLACKSQCKADSGVYKILFSMFFNIHPSLRLTEQLHIERHAVHWVHPRWILIVWRVWQESTLSHIPKIWWTWCVVRSCYLFEFKCEGARKDSANNSILRDLIAFGTRSGLAKGL